MQKELAYNPWVQGAGLTALLGSLAAYAYTGNYFLLAIPFGILFLLLLLLNWKLAYWFLIFSIPGSVQIFLAGGALSTSLPDEPLMWTFMLLLLVMLAANPRLLPEWFLRHPLTLIVALQYVWMLVTVVFSQELLFSVKFLLAKTWFLSSFFVLPILVFRDKKDFRRGFLLFMVPLVLTVMIIFARHYTMGFGFRRIERAIMHIYYNHVDYSTVMSMFFPVLCVAYPLTKGMKWYWRWALLGIIVFFLPAIYLTYARAAMIAVVFALGIGLAIRLRLVKLVMPVFYGAIITVVVLLSSHNRYLNYYPNLNQTYMHFTFTDHMIATFKGEDMSSMERLYRWIAAVRMSKDRPIVGYGPNSFYYHYKPYAVQSFKTWVSRNPEGSTTHNYFLYMLVEQGWPAMILYAILVMVFFAQAQKVYWRFNDRFYRYCTLGVAMMFAAGFINNFFSELIETHKVGGMFYLCISLLIVLDRKSKELERDDVPIAIGS